MAIYDENRLVVNTLTDTNTPSILTTTKIRESIGDVFDVSTKYESYKTNSKTFVTINAALSLFKINWIGYLLHLDFLLEQ